MHNLINKIKALTYRNFLITASYRLTFFLDLIYVAGSVTMFFFIAKVFDKSAANYLADFNGDYFSFVLIGIAFNGYLSSALNSFNLALSNEQADGTLETLLLSPTPVLSFFSYTALVNFGLVLIKTAVYLIFGWLVFKFDLSNLNILTTLVILLLTTIAYSAIGIFSASFLLVFKRGNPFGWLFQGLSNLFGGVYFPIAVLPLWLKPISFMLPTTYALNALRQAIINGVNLAAVTTELKFLLFFTLLFLPLSILCFNIALNKTKINGSLLYS